MNAKVVQFSVFFTIMRLRAIVAITRVILSACVAFTFAFFALETIAYTTCSRRSFLTKRTNIWSFWRRGFVHINETMVTLNNSINRTQCAKCRFFTYNAFFWHCWQITGIPARTTLALVFNSLHRYNIWIPTLATVPTFPSRTQSRIRNVTPLPPTLLHMRTVLKVHTNEPLYAS